MGTPLKNERVLLQQGFCQAEGSAGIGMFLPPSRDSLGIVISFSIDNFPRIVDISDENNVKFV